MQAALKQIRNIVTTLVLIFSSVYFVSASQTVGTIDAVSHYAKVCHDVSCSTYGNINFLPTSTSTAIVITDTSITGYAWGDEIGWINMAPTGAGVTVDPATGILYGTAFSSIGGWVNFRPTNGGVTINASGELVGYAWVGGLYGGWIKFDCASPDTCVKTDWRAIQYRPIVVTNNNTGGVLPFNAIQTTSTVTVTVYTNPPMSEAVESQATQPTSPRVYPRYTEPRVQTVVQPNTYTTYQPTYTNTYVPPVLANKVETKTRVIAFPFVPSRTRVPVKVGGVKIDMVSVVLVTLVLVLLIMAIRLRALV
jgi:hypothetical protein